VQAPGCGLVLYVIIPTKFENERIRAMIREQRTQSNDLLNIDFYPVYDNSGLKMRERAPKSSPSSEQQKKYNENRAALRLIQLVNANFTKKDFFCHFTFSPDRLPKDEDDALRIINNYFRRVQYYRNKKGLAPVKHIGVLEGKCYRDGRYCGLINYHFHIFIQADGMSSDEYEAIWTDGEVVRIDHFRPRIFGPEAAARYISKDPKGKKRWFYSKGLKQPKKKKPLDGKVGRKTVERMSTVHVEDREYWENRYKGYDFIKAFPRFNEYNGHWYLSVVMFKKDEPSAIKKKNNKKSA